LNFLLKDIPKFSILEPVKKFNEFFYCLLLIEGKFGLDED